MQLTPTQQRYWRTNLRLTSALLLIWFLATFVVGWYARELQTIVLFGFPFSFYMAAQGALLIYLLLVGYYAWRMERLDHECGVQEED